MKTDDVIEYYNWVEQDEERLKQYKRSVKGRKIRMCVEGTLGILLAGLTGYFMAEEKVIQGLLMGMGTFYTMISQYQDLRAYGTENRMIESYELGLIQKKNSIEYREAEELSDMIKSQ